jgi:hypothetical protein
MNLFGGSDVPPYDSAIDQPGFELDWIVDEWTDPDDSVVKTNLTQYYRDDAWFAAPSTGNQLENVNATQIYASLWYFKAPGVDAWIYDNVVDIKRVDIIGDHAIRVFFDTTGYWNAYLGTSYILSFNLLGKGTMSQNVVESRTSDATTGYCNVSENVFWVNSAFAGATELVRGVDYEIYGTPPPNSAAGETDVRIINPVYKGVLINLDYLAVDDARGSPTGGLPWQDAFEGAGMYYCKNWEGGLVGTSMTFKKNPHYPMETPPLGEIDFIKKPSGCYKIDIYDVVAAASAYGSKGDTVPDPTWLPAADVAPGGESEIMVNIYDIVTITGQYDVSFDCPP